MEQIKKKNNLTVCDFGSSWKNNKKNAAWDSIECKREWSAGQLKRDRNSLNYEYQQLLKIKIEKWMKYFAALNNVRKHTHTKNLARDRNFRLKLTLQFWKSNQNKTIKIYTAYKIFEPILTHKMWSQRNFLITFLIN